MDIFAHAIFSRRNVFQLMEDIDKNSKQEKVQLYSIQLNHINYCPVPQQMHQILYNFEESKLNIIPVQT